MSGVSAQVNVNFNPLGLPRLPRLPHPPSRKHLCACTACVSKQAAEAGAVGILMTGLLSRRAS